MKTKLNKTVIADLPVPANRRSHVYDERTPGLAVCVTNRGTRTFYLIKKFEGRTLRIRIGRFPEMTIDQARARAAEMGNDLVRGINPQARRRDTRKELTLGDAFDRWLATHAKIHNKGRLVLRGTSRLVLFLPCKM